MKVVVFGASGLAGSYLSRLFSKEGHNVVRASSSSPGMDYNLDASDAKEVGRLLAKEKPGLVINAVKSSISTDAAEERREETWKANVMVPENLARAQGANGYLLFHLSTDWVYDGVEGETYTEESLAYPLNFYAYSKAIAEERIRLFSSPSRHLIARTTGVFGMDMRKRDFFSRFLAAAEKGGEFPAADDQFSQPIYAGELARLAHGLVSSGCSGTYNCVGPDYVSRYRLALLFAKEFGHREIIRRADSSARKIRIPTHLRVDISKLDKICKVKSLAAQIRDLKKETGG